MIVLLLEKIEKRIYDYKVVEISLQNFSAKTFKAASEKNGHIRLPKNFPDLPLVGNA